MSEITQTRKQKAKAITQETRLGASFSLISCGPTNYNVDWQKALQSTLDLGIRRFRMMTYWNLCESVQGTYNFTDVDKQLEIVEKAGGKVTLTIGMRQPRWPETHIPDWTNGMAHDQVEQLYLKYHTAVVNRYKDSSVVDSWQLENEFWLRSFGEHFDFSRTRLEKEFQIIRELNPERPIIMSLAQIVSLPLFKPTPDIYATSVYRNIYNSSQKKYTYTWAKPWVYRLKRFLIRLTKRRDLVIHELQAEPWGPQANWEMSKEEQFKSMNPEQIKLAVQYAQDTGISYMDLWGAEWWYWFSLQPYGDDSLQQIVAELVKKYD